MRLLICRSWFDVKSDWLKKWQIFILPFLFIELKPIKSEKMKKTKNSPAMMPPVTLKQEPTNLNNTNNIPIMSYPQPQGQVISIGTGQNQQLINVLPINQVNQDPLFVVQQPQQQVQWLKSKESENTIWTCLRVKNICNIELWACNYFSDILTVLKCQDFSVTQILREINFGDSRSSKAVILEAHEICY